MPNSVYIGNEVKIMKRIENAKYMRHAHRLFPLFLYVGMTDKKVKIWFARGSFHEPPGRCPSYNH